jgi:hypothetical protein
MGQAEEPDISINSHDSCEKGESGGISETGRA